ncbi:MAG: hypothetical protein ACYCYM_03635 [Saccharofermentanales bacterium]
MAKKDAFCTQCGSLVQIDDSKDKNVCIFCKAEINTKKALELNTDTESRLLLQKAAEQKAKEESIALKEKNKLNKSSGSEVITTSKAPRQEIILKPLPLKIKLAVFGAFLLLVVVLAAIYVPLVLNRNAKRIAMDAAIAKDLGIESTSTAFKDNDNRKFVLSTAMTLDEGTAIAAFEKYVDIYSDIYEISADKVRSRIVVTLYDAAGRYVCSYSDGAASAVFETATPTHAPTPTQSITN